MGRGQELLTIFHLLLDHFGQRHWWPGETVAEIVVGAILTQNTAWKNVQKAIRNMKMAGILSLEGIQTTKREELAEIIRPSGFFNIKALRLKNFVTFVTETYGGLEGKVDGLTTADLRRDFLGVNGIGPETADSILLYALQRPVFVVDAYTKRFVRNHGLLRGPYTYSAIQGFFTQDLPEDTYLFNEYHALIVRLAQVYCRAVPRCSGCPLETSRFM